MKQEIVEEAAIRKIINSLFGKLPVSVNAGGSLKPVKIVALKDQGLVVNLPVDFTSSNNHRILMLTHNGNKILAEFSKLGGDAKGLELLKPLKITIVQATIENVRKQASDDTYLTEIINQNDILKALGFNDKRLDAIIAAYTAKLKKAFPFANLVIGSRQDNRLRMMTNYDRIIFVPNRSDKGCVPPEFLPFDEYLRILTANKVDPKLRSEISIPVKYKGYVPLGYIHVMGTEAFDMNMLNTVKSVVQSLTNDIMGIGLFKESKERCEVVDISHGGVGFLHPQSIFANRSFAVSESICFDIHFGNKGIGSFKAIIRSIKNTESSFKLGVQFHLTTENNAKLLELVCGPPKTEVKEANSPKEETPDVQAEESVEELAAQE